MQLAATPSSWARAERLDAAAEQVRKALRLERMVSGLPRMIRAATDRVPLIWMLSRDARTPFRLARADIRGADRIRRTGRAVL